jgi:sigma-E factor negative regulatory protein RseC
MAKIATHPATVTDVKHGTVQVQLHVVSACASCEAHGRCGFADSKEKIMDIDTPQWQQYRVGDPVTVTINANRGLQAVLIAYILPALLLLATFVALTALHLSEGWVALLTLLVVALYGVLLYTLRHRLQRKFTMSISPKA